MIIVDNLSNNVYNYHTITKGEDIMQEKSALALRLKMLRREKGLTAQQVADALGIKSATYRRYEIDTKPRDEVYIALAEFFGVSVDYLMSGKTSVALSAACGGSDYIVLPENQISLSPAENALILSLRSLSSEEQNEVFEFVNWKCVRAKK